MMKRISIVVAMLAVLSAGCADASGDVTIVDPWARASASMQSAGAVYMTIDGGDIADELVGVAVPESVAMVAELHEATMVQNDDGGTMMGMQQVTSIAVPAGGTVALEPGGYHVMLMQLAEPLVDGTEFTITLTFEQAGDITTTVDVRTDE